jgi:DNA-binding LytR/AlgR family response regulator
MTEVAELLPDNFVRIYKSNIINLLRIKKIEDHQVILDDGTKYPDFSKVCGGVT